MLWARYEHQGKTSFGIVEGDTIQRVEGSPFSEYSQTSDKARLGDVKLLVPTIPGVFYVFGTNYREHVGRYNEKHGKSYKVAATLDVAYRANNSLIASGEDIIKPKNAGKHFDYEGELVAVMGKKCRNVSKEDALKYVLGWTIGNDISARDWQHNDRTNWRAKNSDTFNPMGPWIATDLDYRKMRTTVRLNGKVMDSFDTGNMVFHPNEIISRISEHATLHPGDVVWLGTDGLPENMNGGDVCEIEISGIGTLRNRVVDER